jgi:ABC-type antimicrobial peptide transport system permease subunit
MSHNAGQAVIWRNLFRRKGRTILTLLGIGIGVATIVGLGAAAQGIRAGFSSMTRGSQADLVLTQADALSALMSSIDESMADELRTWPEVADVDGVLFSNALMNGSSYIFLFGHDPNGFSVAHYRIVEGQALAEATAAPSPARRGLQGKSIVLGRQAAERLDKQVGDTLRITGSAFRVVGIYETGDGFEDGGAVVSLEEAQSLALQPRQVSMLYLKLRDLAEAERVRSRVERSLSDLTVSSTSGFGDQEQLVAILEGAAMGIAGLAVLIGGVVMTNTLLMSVFERTREIGLLRAVGWRRGQVLRLILGESLALSLGGGLLGVGMGVGLVHVMGRSSSVLSAFGSNLTPQLIVRGLVTVIVLGLVGGAYPAWWASRLPPVEALRYEGGGGGRVPRFLPGGMVTRTLVRRKSRTALTLLAIGIGIASVVALGGVAQGMLDAFTRMMRDAQTDLLAIEAGIDNDFSAIDERVGARIAARPDVKAVSGMIMTAANTEQEPMLLVFAYHPREFAIRRFRIVEGRPLQGRREVIVGSQAAENMGLGVGDTLRLLKSNFRVVGIYETGLAFEEIGVVIGLREGQTLTGKPRQVQFYAISLRDPDQVEGVKQELKAAFPEIDFALTSELAETMSDFRVMEQMVDQISSLAVFIGGLGMLNTMLMSVLERTREIGVLRALGWSRRQVLSTILRESLVLGLAGGLCGTVLGVGLGGLVGLAPGMYAGMKPIYSLQLFLQAVIVALIAGALGGLYPAWRATRMRPVEALRYE